MDEFTCEMTSDASGWYQAEVFVTDTRVKVFRGPRCKGPETARDSALRKLIALVTRRKEAWARAVGMARSATVPQCSALRAAELLAACER